MVEITENKKSDSIWVKIQSIPLLPIQIIFLLLIIIPIVAGISIPSTPSFLCSTKWFHRPMKNIMPPSYLTYRISVGIPVKWLMSLEPTPFSNMKNPVP